MLFLSMRITRRIFVVEKLIKDMEEKEYITINVDSLRKLAEALNSRRVQKEDIIAVFPIDGRYSVLYYGKPRKIQQNEQENK